MWPIQIAWHVDENHSLVTWGFVIHGGIVGFSSPIVYLKFSTDNRSNTVLDDMFLTVTQNCFEWPESIRSDHGGETVGVWNAMEEISGLNRGSFLLSASLSSTFNQFNFYTLNGIVIPASSTDFPKAQCWEH